MARKFTTNWADVPVVVDLPYASVLLQLHPETLRKLSVSGEFPAKKIGNAWRIEKSRLMEYLENRKDETP